MWGEGSREISAVTFNPCSSPCSCQVGSSSPSHSPGCSHFRLTLGRREEATGSTENRTLGTGSQTTNRGSPKHSVLRASAEHQNVGRMKPSRTHPTRGALSRHLLTHTHQKHLKTNKVEFWTAGQQETLENLSSRRLQAARKNKSGYYFSSYY